MEEVPCGQDDDNKDESLPMESPKVRESLPEEQPEVATASHTATAEAPDHEKKSVRGRKARTVAAKAAEEKPEATEHPEDHVAPAPVRGRRGKKTEATAPPTARQTRNKRNDVDLTVEESASESSEVNLKPKRGRNAKKAFEEQAEPVQEIVTEMEVVPEVVSEQISPVDVGHESNDSTEAPEEAVSKPKRGRKTKQESVPSKSVPEVPCDAVPQADVTKGITLFHLFFCFRYF